MVFVFFVCAFIILFVGLGKNGKKRSIGRKREIVKNKIRWRRRKQQKKYF